MNIKVFVTCMVFDEAENIKDVGLVVDDSKGQFSCRGWWWVITEKIRIRFDTSDNVDNGIMELEGNQSDHLKMNFSYTMQEMPQRSSAPLQQIMKMRGWRSLSSPVSSSSVLPLSNLKELYIWSIEDLESLPEIEMQNLSSFRLLSIW
uniref:Uncharacterized protein n=1 Tax=Salix viminalis TaxID=40686 RepID=A0A6N2NKC9_SALVM